MADIERLGEVVGFNPDTYSDEARTAMERCFDEVFERGYQAGVQDGKECV